MGRKEELRRQTGRCGNPETHSRRKPALPLGLKRHRTRSRAIWWMLGHRRQAEAMKETQPLLENSWLLHLLSLIFHGWDPARSKLVREMGQDFRKGGRDAPGKMDPTSSSSASNLPPSQQPPFLPSHPARGFGSLLGRRSLWPMSDSKVIIRLNLPTLVSV